MAKSPAKHSPAVPLRQVLRRTLIRHPAALPLVMALAALIVDGAFVTRPGLWRDEAATGWVVQHPLSQIIELCRHWDVVLLGYYGLVHSLVKIFGFSVLTLRLPSVIAAALGTAALTATGRRLGGVRLAVACGACYILLPRTLWAAVEARPYAWTSAAVAWALWALVRALGAPHPGLRHWLPWAGLAVTAVHLHLHAAIVIMLLTVAGLVLGRTVRVRILLCLSSLLVAAACLPLAIKAKAQALQVAWISTNGPFDSLAEQLLVDAYFPYRTAAQYVSSLQAGVRWFAWTLAGIVSIALVLCLIRRALPARLLWLGLFPVAGFPLVLLAAGQLSGQSLLIDRYFSVACPPLALLLGAVARRFPWRRAGVLLLAGAACCTLVLAAQQRTRLAKSYLDDQLVIAQFLEQHARPGDAFVFEDEQYSGPAAPDSVDSGRYALASYPRAFDGLIDVAQPQLAPLDAPWPLDSAADAAQAMSYERLWVISVRLDRTPGLTEQLTEAGRCRQEQYAGTEHIVSLWTGC